MREPCGLTEFGDVSSAGGRSDPLAMRNGTATNTPIGSGDSGVTGSCEKITIRSPTDILGRRLPPPGTGSYFTPRRISRLAAGTRTRKCVPVPFLSGLAIPVDLFTASYLATVGKIVATPLLLLSGVLET